MKSTIALAGLALLATCSQAGEKSLDLPSVEVTATYVQFERVVVEKEPGLRKEGCLAHSHILKMSTASSCIRRGRLCMPESRSRSLSRTT